jgi:hypothetical protein
MSNEIARPGVFLPTAAVACVDCKATKGINGPRSSEADSYEKIAICDDCRAPIWVRDDVAECQRAMYMINDDDDTRLAARVAQTGGMCCATTVTDGGDSYHVFVTPGETDDESPFVVGGYFNDGEVHGTHEEGYGDLLMEGVTDTRLLSACEEMFKRLAACDTATAGS